MSGYSGQVISDKPVSPPEDIPAERVQELIHSVTVRITQQVAQINLQIGEHPPPPKEIYVRCIPPSRGPTMRGWSSALSGCFSSE